MKKIYQTPALTILHTEAALPIAASLEINNTAQDGVAGDVKSTGDWDNIWGDEE